MAKLPWLYSDSPQFFPIRRQEDPADELPWPAEDEGALSLDLHDYHDALVIRAPIAGVRPQDLDLSINHDMLTIRGMRVDPDEENENRVTLHQECHWGPFSRSIILPSAINQEEASASLKDGVLTIRLPKSAGSGRIPLVE